MADTSTHSTELSEAQNRKLFLACFVALVTTSFAFITRALTLPQWGEEFKLTNTQIGEIAGVGLWPFAISIVLFSLVSAIPLGGYVKMYGEQIDEEVAEPERSFNHQSVWTRIPIVAAGPGFNFGFAIILIALIHVVGVPVETSVRIGQVLADSAAAEAGLQTGDVVSTFEGEPIERIHELKTGIMESEGRTVALQVLRNDQLLNILITPHQDEAAKEWRIGVELQAGSTTVERVNPLAALGQGVGTTWQITRLTFVGFGKIISGAIPASESLAGPIGIAREIGRQADYGWRNVVFFTAAISVSLAILNLLPIPVLDGGHLLFFAIEIVNGRPLSLRKREIAQQVGLLILVSLMLFAFYNDIMNLFVPR